MHVSALKGIAFGFTSAIITTLGMMVGLQSGSNSRIIVLGGIVTIAVADAFSDALGIHISEETQNKHHREVWTSTVATFLSKLILASTFIIPILLFDLKTAVIVSIAWGLSILTLISYLIAREYKRNPWETMGEHLFIGIMVIVITHFLGDWVAMTFR